MKIFVPVYNRIAQMEIDYAQDNDFIFVAQGNDPVEHKVKNLIVIDECKSLCYKRNKIVEYCRQNNIRYCIQCDDNVTHFIDNNKNKIETKIALETLEDICKQNHIMTTGCKNGFVFAGKPGQFGNGVLFQAFVIDLQKTALNFELYNDVCFEDFIFSIKNYQIGNKVTVCKWLSPVKQKMKGSYSADYTQLCVNTQKIVGPEIVNIKSDKKFVKMIELKKPYSYNYFLKNVPKKLQFGVI